MEIVRNVMFGVLLMCAGAYCHQLAVHNGVIQAGLVIKLEEGVSTSPG